MLKSLSLLTHPRFPPFLALRRISVKEMSATPSTICPKFVPVGGADIQSRSKPDENCDGTAGIRFRLVSYNILAQVYIKSSLFPHSPSPCLKWKARSRSILTVLKNLEADFLCLQEVDEFDTFYKLNMESLGYFGVYIQRGGQKCDGCGIFFRQNCAELLIEERIEYNDLVNTIGDDLESQDDKHELKQAKGSSLKSTSKDHGNPNDPRVRLKRDCVAIMAAFELKGYSRHVVIVANTHLYWDPAWADVKLAQAKCLLSRLQQFKEVVSDQFECTPSVILAGDFNSTPGDKVYQYLISGNSSPATLGGCLDELPIPLCSVYGCTRGEPPFTNCTPGFTNTLDFIFFSPDDQIKPLSILELPEPNSADVLGGLPNYHHPSDHLPIGAEFEISKE